MPLSLSIASFANGVAWTIYACLPFDPYILVISSHIFLPKLNILTLISSTNSTINFSWFVVFPHSESSSMVINIQSLDSKVEGLIPNKISNHCWLDFSH